MKGTKPLARSASGSQPSEMAMLDDEAIALRAEVERLRGAVGRLSAAVVARDNLLLDGGQWCTEAERWVLDTTARPWQESGLDYTFDDWARAVWQAELARRQVKP